MGHPAGGEYSMNDQRRWLIGQAIDRHGPYAPVVGQAYELDADPRSSSAMLHGRGDGRHGLYLAFEAARRRHCAGESFAAIDKAYERLVLECYVLTAQWWLPNRWREAAAVALLRFRIACLAATL